MESQESPLFVIGNPRSGTSLLRLILTSHSKIIIPPECGFIIWLYKKYFDWTLSDLDSSGRIRIFIDDLQACKKFETWSLSKDLLKHVIEKTQPGSYPSLCASIVSAYGEKQGKEYSLWGDKNNFYHQHLEELLHIYPRARFLHLVRDGRDVACSYREVMASTSDSPYAPKLHIDISDIAREWSSNIMRIDTFMHKLPASNYRIIKYEELVGEPEKVIAQLCYWLKLPYESGMLEFYQQNREKQLEPALTMDWKMRTLKPVSSETVGRYKYLLNPEERKIFSSIAENSLSKFCYEL